jgi:hypothetical protein
MRAFLSSVESESTFTKDSTEQYILSVSIWLPELRIPCVKY